MILMGRGRESTGVGSLGFTVQPIAFHSTTGNRPKPVPYADLLFSPFRHTEAVFIF